MTKKKDVLLQTTLEDLEYLLEKDITEYKSLRGPDATVKFINQLIDKVCGIL
jgi:hypothetical protein